MTCFLASLKYIYIYARVEFGNPFNVVTIEGTVPFIKTYIMAHESPNPWTTTLPAVLLGAGSAVKELLGRSAAELIYDTTLRLPGEFTQKYTANAHTDLDNYSDTRSHVASPFVPTARHTSEKHFPI